MQNNKKGFLVARLQPLHSGHRHLIREAAKQVKELIVFIGSANQCRSIRNPFTYLERRDMLIQFLRHEGIKNVGICPLNDYPYTDAQWIADVRAVMDAHVDVTFFGHMKEGNNYLNFFPDYKYVNIDSDIKINATGIRQNMFETNDPRIHADVRADYAYFKKEAETFSVYPYPETLKFSCADVIVECSGHIILIQRIRAPGRNTWALPGGFVEQRETYLDAAIRELREETGVKVPEKVLRGSIVKSEMFDSPNRGHGIPRVTMVQYIKIQPNPDGTLPDIKPADDALDAKWIPINEALNTYFMFDDHKEILSKMTGVNPLPAIHNPIFF